MRALWYGAGRSLGTAFAVATLLALGACGFEPLYAPSNSGTGPGEELAKVRIAPMPDRIGQQMHNLLRDRLNPHGQPAKEDYRLEVKLEERAQQIALRGDETATRANLTVVAEYSLRRAEGAAVATSGRISSTNSYDILESRYATIVSQNDARERALRELSDTIRNRLALYFTGS